MKILNKVFIAAIFFIYGIISTDAQKNSAPAKITTIEGVTEYRLSNGLTVLLFPDSSKATITVNVTYMVGSRVEGYGETGMAHLLEHMVFKGSTNHTNIPQELTAHGAQPNGSTWYDRTNYFETFTASDDNLRWALELESDRMVNSFIAKKDLETEFSVVRNEFEMGENYPSAVLQERIMSTAYLWHNYGKSTIGSKEDIERVPIENLQAFYKKYYQPDNAVLVIAGKIKEEKTLPLVIRTFGSIPKPARVIQDSYTVEPAQDGERYVELMRTGELQVVACGYHIPSGTHADYAAVEALADVLTNEPSGRLYKALVETQKASYVSGYSFALKDPGYLYFSADVLKEKPLEDAKLTMLGLLDSLFLKPVTEEETERAKSKILKDFSLTYNNSEWVGLTLSEYIAQGDWKLWFLFRDRVEKVTADDINRVVKSFIKPSNRTVGVFIPEAKPDRVYVPPPPDVPAMVKDYKGKTGQSFTEAFDPSPANIDARTKTGTIPGGSKYALLNKVTLGNSVHARIILHIGNEEALQNKSLIADLTADMLEMGTATKTRQQIADALDKLKTEAYVYGYGQNVEVSIETVKENLIPVLKLATDVLRHPAFPPKEFEKLVREKISEIEEYRSEPDAIASNAFNRILNPYPATDFRYVMTFDEELEAVKKVKIEDVKNFYNDFYNGTNVTLAVVGAFDEAAVLAELNNMLANWNSAVKYERAHFSFYDIPAKTEKINTPDKTNAMLMCGYNLELRDDNPDYAALLIGNYMLGGGFLNSRLASRIRQKEGISYGVGSYLEADPFDPSGSFGSYAIYNPGNSDKLVAAYKEEIDKMLNSGFTQAELSDDRSGYLQEQKVNRAQDNYLTRNLSKNLYLNRTMQWQENLEKKISGLTVGEVNTAMKKWIHPEKITYVQAGDFERKK